MIIVATGKYIGESFDAPFLDTFFLIIPISWKGTLAQYAGRLHRMCDGKESVQICDDVDMRVFVLERMYGKRLKGYRELGFRIGVPRMPPHSTDLMNAKPNTILIDDKLMWYWILAPFGFSKETDNIMRVESPVLVAR